MLKQSKLNGRAPTQAYSLVELVGVLAIIAVLVGIASSVVFRSVDLALLEAEEESLALLGEGLVEYIREHRTAPGTNSWTTALASMVATPLVDIEKNEKGNERRFLIDPNFWGLSEDAMPYTQSPTGVGEPLSPRFVILSSVGAALPTESIDFQEVWDSQEGELISTNAPWDEWNGNWEHLRVCRVNLSPYFHHVTLHNIGADDAAGFLVDGNGGVDDDPMEIPGGLLDAYFLDGTLLELCSDGETVATEIIRSDRSLYFNRGSWRNFLVEGVGSADALTSYLTTELRDWISLYGYGMTELWFDYRQDRFQLIVDNVDCAELVTLTVETGSDSGWGFSEIHSAGSLEQVQGDGFYLGSGADSASFGVDLEDLLGGMTLIGSFDVESYTLSILDNEANSVPLSAGGPYGDAALTASVQLSSGGLDFGAKNKNLIGTIEYVVDLDALDGVVDEQGSFYLYNHNFDGPANSITSADAGQSYDVSLWGNNFDNVNGVAPSVEEIRGLKLRLTFSPNQLSE